MFRVTLKELLILTGDPTKSWHDGEVTKAKVLALSKDECHLEDPDNGYEWSLNLDKNEEDRSNEHCKRVRWLMLNTEKWSPLFLEENGYGIPELWDGHHRLCAAVFLGLTSVNIQYNGTYGPLRVNFPTSYRKGWIRMKLWNAES